MRKLAKKKRTKKKIKMNGKKPQALTCGYKIAITVLSQFENKSALDHKVMS